MDVGCAGLGLSKVPPVHLAYNPKPDAIQVASEAVGLHGK